MKNFCLEPLKVRSSDFWSSSYKWSFRPWDWNLSGWTITQADRGWQELSLEGSHVPGAEIISELWHFKVRRVKFYLSTGENGANLNLAETELISSINFFSKLPIIIYLPPDDNLRVSAQKKKFFFFVVTIAWNLPKIEFKGGLFSSTFLFEAI